MWRGLCVCLLCGMDVCGSRSRALTDQELAGLGGHGEEAALGERAITAPCHVSKLAPSGMHIDAYLKTSPSHRDTRYPFPPFPRRVQARPRRHTHQHTPSIYHPKAHRDTRYPTPFLPQTCPSTPPAVWCAPAWRGWRARKATGGTWRRGRTGGPTGAAARTEQGRTVVLLVLGW